MLMIWSCMESPVYFISEVYLTDVLKVILLPPMSAESLSTSLRRDEALRAIISVLSVFNMSLLLLIYEKLLSVYIWMPVWTELNSPGGALCDSSVYQHTRESCSEDQKSHPTVTPLSRGRFMDTAMPPCSLLSLAGAATSITRLLSRQMYACRDKTFVATNIFLSRQIFVATKRLSRQNWYLWQLPPMILYREWNSKVAHIPAHLIAAPVTV